MMDIVTQRHINRHTKETDALFILHFQYKRTYLNFLSWLENNGFIELLQRAERTYSENYFEDGVSCVLYESQMCLLTTYFLGKEL